MVKIQHGIAGFFTGAFIGFLLSLIEMRLIDNKLHPTGLFLAICLTVIICGIIGLAKGLKMVEKKRRKSR